MFDLERQYPGIVAAETEELSAEQHQRDVYDSHRHRVFSVAFYMTANELEAEQILTDTFIRVFSQDGARTGQHVDQALVEELSDRFSLESTEMATADPALLLQRTANRRTALEEALPVLTPLERLVFLLSDVEGYPPSKIAPLVRLSELEIQRTALSARIRMRNELAIAQLRAEQMVREQMDEDEQDELEAEEAL